MSEYGSPDGQFKDTPACVPCVPHLKIALSVAQCGTDHIAKLSIHD